MVVGDVAPRGVLEGVEGDTDTILDAGGTKQTTTVAGRIGTERVIVQHKCHTIGTHILVAEIDIEADVKVETEVDAPVRHYHTFLALCVLREGDDVARGIIVGVSI